MNRIIDTDAAPAVGAYSQATETDDRVFTAGQIPLTPDGDLLDDAPSTSRPSSRSRAVKPFSRRQARA